MKIKINSQTNLVFITFRQRNDTGRGKRIGIKEIRSSS